MRPSQSFQSPITNHQSYCLLPVTFHLSLSPSPPLLTSHQSLLTSHFSRPLRALPRVVLLLNPDLLPPPDRLDLPPLPFSPADQIANEKPFEGWNQRHRQDAQRLLGQLGRVPESRSLPYF